VVFASLAVPPVLEVLFGGPGRGDEVPVFALDGAEQLEAFESGLSVEGVCAAGEALLELGAFAFGRAFERGSPTAGNALVTAPR
jgi:hypothetical protein